MTERIVSPTGRGFLLLDSHPAGCARSVADMVAQVAPGEREERAPASPAVANEGVTGPRSDRPPVALVIGSSAGYGLATTIAGLVRHGINGIGIGFERPPGRRTGTAGWYRTIAAAKVAADLGAEFSWVNADAFADTTKDEVLDLIARRFGGIDVLIYSVAAPRRADPRTGTIFSSVIKPIGQARVTKTLEFDSDGAPLLRDLTTQPATPEETAATVEVMGGEDWSRWVEALAGRGLVRDGFRTVALTYIGSVLTAGIYRDGTIGAAKAHLEATAGALTERLAAVNGRAFTSVNGAAVTQASTAIPGIALYVSLLRGVLGEGLLSPLEQSLLLWDQLTGVRPYDLDEQGRIRLDRWELDPGVQADLAKRWETVSPDNVGELADVDWFRSQFRGLYGFDVPGVDYGQPVDPDLPWPTDPQ